MVAPANFHVFDRSRRFSHIGVPAKGAAWLHLTFTPTAESSS